MEKWLVVLTEVWRRYRRIFKFGIETFRLQASSGFKWAGRDAHSGFLFP